MGHEFQTTRWSLVLAAGEIGTSESKAALSDLCEAYWFPLYGFLRRQGCDADEARDLTQGYFLALLEKNYLDDVRPDAGRFRSFLLASLKHFVSKQRDRARAQKRGGGATSVPIDLASAEERYAYEPRADGNPETLFERQWALTVLERAMTRLGKEFEEAGKADRFLHLKSLLTGAAPQIPYRRIAEQLGTTEATVKVTVHRSRRRLGQLIRTEIAETVSTPADVDDEVRYLLRVLQGG